MAIMVEFKQDGQVIGVMVADPKTFSSGADGFFAQGKVVAGEHRFQTQIQMVRIGSKPQTPPKKK